MARRWSVRGAAMAASMAAFVACAVGAQGGESAEAIAEEERVAQGSIVDAILSALGDVDGDGYPNFVDPDSDNDAICDPGVMRTIRCAQGGRTDGFCCAVVAGG